MSATKEHFHDQIEAGQRGKQHKISWLNMPGFKPETWNPIVGCTKISPGCDNCYAEKFAFRLVNMLEKSKSETYHVYQNAANKQGWTGRTALNTDHIFLPLKWKSPRMIFVCSMGDIFHEHVPFHWIDWVYNIIRDCPQHRFIILTKRPERMKEWSEMRTNIYNNLWLGVTAENQEQANKRIPILLSIPAEKHLVSIEPMLGPVDLTKIPAKYWGGEYDDLYNGLSLSSLDGGKDTSTPWHLNWVICGGETGPKARPMHPAWVRSVRDQCKQSGTPFFFKQWGEWLPIATFNGHQYLPLGDYDLDTKYGFRKKKKQYTTNILYGKEHHEWPTINL